MTVATAPFLLPEDVLLVPMRDVAADVRAKVNAGDDAFAVTRPLARRLSMVVDADSAALLGGFRERRTIAEAVLRFARERNAEPETVLAGAMPVLRRLINAGLLVNAEDPRAKPIVALHEAGDVVEGYALVRLISLLEDVEVYQARGPDDAVVLLKIARPSDIARQRAAFAREAEVLAMAAGAPVPRVTATGESRGLPYLAIAWCDGVYPIEAAGEFRSVGAAGRAGIRGLAVALCEAYASLHEAGIAHGDIHDGNVMVDGAGRVTLVDFGSATTFDAADPPPRVGILRNYDPEVVRAKIDGVSLPRVTPAAEQYSLGTLLYEMATNKPSLDLAVHKESAWRQIRDEIPLPFADRGAEPWPGFEAVLARMLAKAPEERFPSMRAAAEAFRAFDIAPADATRPSTAPAIRTQDFVRDMFARVALDGPLYVNGAALPPYCSINSGAAGIATAWYRRALVEESAEHLATASAWARRAETWSTRREAWYPDDKTISPQNVGRSALYHTPTGLACAHGLICYAFGDFVTGNARSAAFEEASRKRDASVELTTGRGGVLVGAALLREATPHTLPALQAMGDRLARLIAKKTLEHRDVRSGKTRFTMAHGVAGPLYALLRWSEATGKPLPSGIAAMLGDLATCGVRAGRGTSWPSYYGGRDLAPTWCNGDAGMVHLWLLAGAQLGEPRYVDLAARTGWNVWHGSRDTMYDLCCGMAGRAHALLALYRATGDAGWLRRARLLAERAASRCNFMAGDAHRLYKGALGVALLMIEIESPDRARMPLFESEGWKWTRTTTS